MYTNLDFYKDKALIIISRNSPKVITQPVDGKSSYREDKIYLRDGNMEIMTMPVKNIVIELTGDEKDLSAIIKQINWKSLADLLNK